MYFSTQRRMGRYAVTTNSSGVATVTFDPPFVNPHIMTSVQSVDTGDSRQVNVEFNNLTGNGVTLKTTREGTGISLLGLIALSPTARVSATVHLTVVERG